MGTTPGSSVKSAFATVPPSSSAKSARLLQCKASRKRLEVQRSSSLSLLNLEQSASRNHSPSQTKGPRDNCASIAFPVEKNSGIEATIYLSCDAVGISLSCAPARGTTLRLRNDCFGSE